MADHPQRAADISVDHPKVVENYRAAHVIAESNLAGTATTEDLRVALQRYRTFFQRLLAT